MDLSIIVPVYNVERYIRPCLESILRQGLDENRYEVIIVNDGTKDRSIEMIGDMIAEHNNITVINQKNQGLSAARNNGIIKSTGDFLLFVDSDDLLVENSIRDLLEDACQHRPEIIIANFVRMTDEEIINGKVIRPTIYTSSPKPEFVSTIEYLDPTESYVWRSLYSRNFLLRNTIHFIPDIFFEDIPFSVECYLKAKKCFISYHTFYIYRQHSGSIVTSVNLKKVMDFNTVIAHLWRLRLMASTEKEYVKIMDIIFTTHHLQNWFIVHNHELLKERKKITKDLKKKVPNLYFQGGLIKRVETFMFRHIPNFYLLLRSWMK